MGLWELTLPTKNPRRAGISSTMRDLHVGVVILYMVYASVHNGCCHGHTVFRNLVFVYLLYKDNAYNFDSKRRERHFTCSGVRTVMVISQIYVHDFLGVLVSDGEYVKGGPHPNCGEGGGLASSAPHHRKDDHASSPGHF